MMRREGTRKPRARGRTHWRRRKRAGIREEGEEGAAGGRQEAEDGATEREEEEEGEGEEGGGEEEGEGEEGGGRKAKKSSAMPMGRAKTGKVKRAKSPRAKHSPSSARRMEGGYEEEGRE
jgi:hypothetical protein